MGLSDNIKQIVFIFTRTNHQISIQIIEQHTSADPGPTSFRTRLARFEGTGAPHYLAIPTEVAATLGGRQGLRLIVTVDGRFTDHLALRRRGDTYFVSAGEAMRRRCRLVIGSEVTLSLGLDDAPHGIPVPRVLTTILRHDPDARQAFGALSPGARRTLITRVRKTRTREAKERCALGIADELAGRPRGASRVEWRGGVG